MSVFFLCGNIGLTVNGDVNVVLFCYARCFCCCCCQYCTFEWYCWRLYVLWLALLFVRLPIIFMCFLPICVFVACLDLTWGWFIDRSIDWLIDRSIGCWVTGYLASFGHFLFAPCVHERCDPCEFLLALRGFVELISVMVRFRSSVLFRPRPPRCDWKLPRLGPWARSRTSKGSPPQPEFLKPNTVQKASFLSSKRLRFSYVLAIWRVGCLKPYSWNQYTHRFEA